MTIINRIQPHHIYGVGMILFGVAIMVRPVGGAQAFVQSFHTTPEVAAIPFLVCGGGMLFTAGRPFLTVALTTPLMLYCWFSILAAVRNRGLPFTSTVTYAIVIALIWWHAFHWKRGDP